MWGWKSVERVIDSDVTFEEAKQRILDMGFLLHASNPSHAIFKWSAGNPWLKVLPEGWELPIELAVAESHSGLYLHMRYDTFVAFDTGDLKACADDVVRALVEGVEATES